MKQPKDKRTKAYKDWKANQEKASEGLGDTIAKVTEATGIKKAVKFLAGEDCGCDERQERLNRIFKYNKPECLNEQEYEYIANWIENGNDKLSSKQLREMNVIYNRVFKKKFRCQKCSAQRMMKELVTYFNDYK
tara:strand:+ start:315 stop:716 length:402 start_codon:yes stop_codon:yes gene_type:complete